MYILLNVFVKLQLCLFDVFLLRHKIPLMTYNTYVVHTV